MFNRIGTTSILKMNHPQNSQNGLKKITPKKYGQKRHCSNSAKTTSASPKNGIWPSPNHKVVTFFCSSDTKLDLVSLAGPYGNIAKHVTQPNNTFNLLKVEMSTQAEAQKLFEGCSAKNLPGVFKIVPDGKAKINGNARKPFYEQHLPKEVVEKGLQDGSLLSGQLRISNRSFEWAFINDKEGKDVVIQGLVNRNRALHGDEVVVKVDDESEWLKPKQDERNEGSGVVSDLTGKVEDLSLKEDPVSPEQGHANFQTTRKTGKVVAILKENHIRKASGSLMKKLQNNYTFVPKKIDFPYLLMKQEEIASKVDKQDLSNVMFVAKIASWSPYSKFPTGELCECIGTRGEIEGETTAILTDHSVDFSEFSDAVNDCLPKQLPWSIPKDERNRRRDFTKECIFSIDPSSARDLDDALHCKRLSNGKYEIGVHIADVSYFVKPGTELDSVASQRCTSVYLVQRVVPMLPRLLCEELCSLNPDQERLAFSVVWTVDKTGKVYSQWFGRTIIKSCAKLSYDHAQSIIDQEDKKQSDQTPPPISFPSISEGFSLSQIQTKILDLHMIAQNLRARRRDNGALRLDQVRLAYTLDTDSGLPLGCYPYQYKKSNELIEEFMLLANIAVAHRIYKGLGEKSLLRRHPPPKQDILEDVVSHCNEIGLPIDATSSETLSHSLKEVVGDDEYAMCRQQALFLLAIKPQQLALYFCAGALDDESEFRHYALNVPLYTHFTSPIRRYADVIVHRQLAAVLGDANDCQRMDSRVESLSTQSSLMNTKKMNAKAAGDASSELFFNILVNSHGPLDSKGMVMYVDSNHFTVLSIEYGVVQRIYAKNLPILAFKSEEKKVTGKELRVNELKLKWPRSLKEDVPKLDGDNLPNYEEKDGIEQTIKVFDIVPLTFTKANDESVRNINTFIKSPLIEASISIPTPSTSQQYTN